jgi:hypothetical protein
MKIFVFFVVLCLSAYPQQNAGYSKDVEEFFWSVNKVIRNSEVTNPPDINIDSIQATEIAVKMYSAIANDPAGYYQYISMKNNEWQENVLNNKVPVTSPKYGVYVAAIEKAIAKYKGEAFLRLIKIPYYIKVIITGKENKLFKDVSDNIPFPEVIVKGKVAEIIKGGAKFTLNEEISFFYLLPWYQHAGCTPDFEIGKTYFVPLIITTGEDNVYNKLALALINDGSCSVYNIKDDLINTPGNYFGTGEITGWKKFKNVFIQKYILQYNIMEIVQ